MKKLYLVHLKPIPGTQLHSVIQVQEVKPQRPALRWPKLPNWIRFLLGSRVVSDSHKKELAQ